MLLNHIQDLPDDIMHSVNDLAVWLAQNPEYGQIVIADDGSAVYKMSDLESLKSATTDTRSIYRKGLQIAQFLSKAARLHLDTDSDTTALLYEAISLFDAEMRSIVRATGTIE